MEEIIMWTAELVSRRSTCSRRVKVGAVLADIGGRIIATGYNGVPRHMDHCDDVGCVLDEAGIHCLRAIHAEENAILQCAYYGISTDGLILYTTVRPCERCAVRLLQAGIRKVFYLQDYGGYYTPPRMTIERFVKP